MSATRYAARMRRASGHSAAVRIGLILGGREYHVAQLGGGRLLFDEPVVFPESTGEVVLSVDGQVRRWRVQLHQSATAARSIEAQFVEIA